MPKRSIVLISVLAISYAVMVLYISHHYPEQSNPLFSILFGLALVGMAVIGFILNRNDIDKKIEHKNNLKEPKPGIAIGLSIISIIILANILIFRMDQNNDPLVMIWTGIYIYFCGSIFLASYYFEKKSFIFRWAMWICENFSTPKGRKMAFFYFGLSVLVGTGGIISSLAS